RHGFGSLQETVMGMDLASRQRMMLANSGGYAASRLAGPSPDRYYNADGSAKTDPMAALSNAAAAMYSAKAAQHLLAQNSPDGQWYDDHGHSYTPFPPRIWDEGFYFVETEQSDVMSYAPTA